MGRRVESADFGGAGLVRAVEQQKRVLDKVQPARTVTCPVCEKYKIILVKEPSLTRSIRSSLGMDSNDKWVVGEIEQYGMDTYRNADLEDQRDPLDVMADHVQDHPPFEIINRILSLEDEYVKADSKFKRALDIHISVFSSLTDTQIKDIQDNKFTCSRDTDDWFKYFLGRDNKITAR